ncbi:hypothetical protein CcCBS67573_g10328 [Chytriomyces confervae]|uniref:Protein kinase domain-containing protein n=1 Tax=Chytriomyces confervae TaxID=246404 RepID=A0A507D4I6_9FUNG|nr:hypothetical protein CcCBS67573_g10328 [Chytriomyces confervae]
MSCIELHQMKTCREEEEPTKRRSFADKFNLFRASTGEFFAALFKPRSSNPDGIDHSRDGNSGSVVVEDERPQEPQPRKTVLNAFNKLGTAFIGSTAPRTPSSDAVPEVVTTRAEDMAGFLNGSKVLSPNFTKRYKLGRLLVEGRFAFVMTATRLTDGRKVAVKFIDVDKIPRNTWLPDRGSATGGYVPPEIAILQQLDHPNIIQYIDHVVEPTKYVLLITELHGSDWQRASSSSTTLGGDDGVTTCTSFDLFECIDHRLPDPVARKIFAQIALAVNYLHANGIVHRDFKDENVVVDSNYNIRIIDFGSAAPIPKSQRAFFAQFQGTALYASPEIVRKEMYRGPEDEMWAVGVLLYTMVVGGSPFHSDAEILEGTVRMPRGFHLESDKDYHGGCRHLIQRLLDCDPETRITIEEVLEHSWLKKEVEFYQTAYQSSHMSA